MTTLAIDLITGNPLLLEGLSGGTSSSSGVTTTTFNSYTASTDTTIQNIENDINYLSGVTDTKLNIVDFTGYTASTDTTIQNIENDIFTLSASTGNFFDKTTDDSDDITESTTKVFLDSSGEQIIEGVKRFSSQARSTATGNTTFTATPVFDMNNGNYQKMILTGDVTSLTLSNKENGSAYVIVLQQDATGNRAIATPDATFGTRTKNSEEFSLDGDDKNIINVFVDPDGATAYSIEIVEL